MPKNHRSRQIIVLQTVKAVQTSDRDQAETFNPMSDKIPNEQKATHQSHRKPNVPVINP